MQADDVRRQRHGDRTTFVRVADIVVEPRQPATIPSAAGEIRICGTPASRGAAIDRVSEVVPAAKGIPVSAFSLADLEELALRDRATLRSLLEELRAAGL